MKQNTEKKEMIIRGCQSESRHTQFTTACGVEKTPNAVITFYWDENTINSNKQHKVKLWIEHGMECTKQANYMTITDMLRQLHD